MNQAIKKVIYKKGSKEQIQMMEDLGGMNEEERKLLEFFNREGLDVGACLELGVSQTALADIEEQMRTKMENAIFFCINYTYFHYYLKMIGNFE